MIRHIIASAEKMGIAVTDEQAKKLLLYHEMLVKTNKEMNLTRVADDPIEAADRNYLDSLSIVPYIKDAKTLIDVGTGAGFPGIPVSILCPHVRVTLMDALNKRVGFLKSVIEALDLNAQAVHFRAEDAAKKAEFRDSFDIAAARAVAEMNVLTEWLMPFVRVGGRMLSMKGPNADDEMQRAENALSALNGKLLAIHRTQIPGRDWDHRIIEIEKTAPTPDRFPRRPGVAEKKPL